MQVRVSGWVGQFSRFIALWLFSSHQAELRAFIVVQVVDKKYTLCPNISLRCVNSKLKLVK